MITSKSNQWIKLCRAILEQYKSSKLYFLAEGVKLISSLQSVSKPLVLLCSEQYAKVNNLSNLEDPLVVTDQLWTNLNLTSRIVGIFEKPQPQLLELKEAQDLIILDQIQDPGNLGTLIRTAVACNWHNLICLPGTTNPFSLKSIRASAGAIAGLKIFTQINIQALNQVLADNDFTVIQTSSHAQISISKINLAQIKKPCLVLGNEGAGVSGEIKTGLNLKIPIHNTPLVESLNVAVAGSLFLYKLKNLI